jgi:hypothetical protein
MAALLCGGGILSKSELWVIASGWFDIAIIHPLSRVLLVGQRELLNRQNLASR